MAFSDSTKINISLKKLSGKAHTSNDKGLANEGLPSNVTLGSATIFGETIPGSPTTTNLYDRSGTGTYQVELVRFECEFITGTDTSSGRHAFKLKLPSGYNAGSSHGPTGAFTNSAVLHSSAGALQLVPPSYGASYEAKPYYGGSATKDSGTQIPLLDARDWTLDYYNGILFQQDPPGTGDHSNNPDFIEAYLYIGKYLSTVVAAAGGGSPGGSTTQIQFNDASSFAGDTNLTFNKTTDTLSTVNLTGSLTRLSDGTAYINAGSGVTVSTGSNGAITINAPGSTDLTGMQFVTFGTEVSLTNERVLTAAEGITISTANPQEIAISANRSKKFFDITGSHALNQPFDCHAMNFSTVEYNSNRIDVFLNGQSLRSGSSYDYVLHSTGSIKFKSDLEIDDLVQVIIF